MRGMDTATFYPEVMVPYGSDGLYLPREYRVEVDDPECPVILELTVAMLDGRPECVDLRARHRANGLPISSEHLRRIALRRYVRESTWLYSVRVQTIGETELVHVTGGDDSPLLSRAHQQRRRGPIRPITDELLSEVADVYRGGEPAGTRAVVQHFHTSRATASRWVGAARKNGFLPT